MAKKKKKDLLNVASDIAKKVENTANTTVKKTVNNVVNENNNVDYAPIKKPNGLDFSATTIKTSDIGKGNEFDINKIQQEQIEKAKQKREEQKKQEAEKIVREKRTGKKDPTIADREALYAKSGAAGAVKGGTGIVDAPLQEGQAALEKGKKIKTKKQLEGQAIKTVASAVNPYLTTLYDSVVDPLIHGGKKKKEKSNKKNDIVGNVLNATGKSLGMVSDMGPASTKGIKEALTGYGAVDKSAAKKVKNIRKSVYKPSEYMDKEVQKQLDSYNYNDLDKTVSGVTGIVGNMAPSVVATLATKNPNIGLATMGASVKGQATKEAEDKGKSLDEAINIGNAKAGIEVGTEMLTGGLNIFGKGALDNIAEQGVNKLIKNNIGNFIAKKGLGIAGEAFEEDLSNRLNAALDRVTTDPNAKYTAKDALESARDTALSTLLLNAIGGGYGRRAYNQNVNEINATKTKEKIDKINKEVKINNELKNNRINDIANQIASANIKPNIENANLSTEVQQQMKDGRFGKKMMLDLVSTQKVQDITQALQKGEISPIEANEEMEVIKQTIENQRKQINENPKNIEQMSLEDFGETTKLNTENLKTEEDFEKAFDDIEKSNLPQEQKLQVANELVKASEQINNQVENKQLEQDLVQNEVENNPQNEKYNQLKTLVDSGAIQEGSALYNDFKQLEKEITPKENTIQQPQQETNNEEIDIKQPEILDKMPKENKGFKGTLGDIKKVQKRIRQGMVDHLQPVYDIARKTNNMTLYHKADAIQSAPQIAQDHLGSKQTNLQGKSYANFTNYAKIEKLQSKINNIKNNSELTEDQKTKQINKLQNKIKQNQNVEMGFEKAYDMYKDIPVKDKNTYLVHQLNLDRTSQGTNQFNFSPEESEKIIKNLEEKYKGKNGENKIKNWAENIWSYNRNQLQNMVDGGLITQEQADTFLNDTPHYVRIQRDVGNTNRPVLEIKNGNLKVNNPIQKIKGSELATLPIKETTAEYTEQVLRAIKTNQFGQELAKTMGVSATGGDVSAVDEAFGINPDLIGEDANGNYTFTIFNNGVPTTIPINKEIARALTPRDIKTSNLNPAMHIAKIQKALLTDKNPVFMLTNGVKDFGDMMLYSKYSTARTLKTYGQLFGGRTAGRALGKATGGQRIFENAPTAAEWLNLYESLGGNSSSIFNEGEFTSNKGKISKAIDKALTPIEKGNQFVESMPRLVEFVNTIEANGYTLNSDGEIVVKSKYDINKLKEKQQEIDENSKFTEEQKLKKIDKIQKQIDKVEAGKKGPSKSVDEVLNEAMYNAADITVNFKRGGTWTKNIDKNGAIYLNAGVQGASKFTRNITEAFGDAKSGNYKPAIRLMSRVVGLGIAPAVINQIVHGGDKDYEDEPEYIKDQYYLIGKTKDGDWIRIPKGRAVSLFESAARRTGRATNGGKFGLADYAGLIQNQVAPANPLESNVLSPLKAVAENKAWSGNAIVSDYLQTLPTEEQFDAKTSEISKWLGKTLGLSPKKVDYLLDQYSGGLGDLILPNTTAYAESKSNSGFDALINPLKSKFTTDPVLTNKTTSRYYDMIKDLEKMGKSKNADNFDKARYEYIGDRSDVKYHLSELYSEQRDIQNDTTLSDAEKYRKNRKKQDEINKYMKKIISDINSSEDNGDGSISIGDKTYAEYIGRNGKTKMKDVPMKKVVTAYSLGMGVGDYVRLDSEIYNMKADRTSSGKIISGSKKRKAASYLKTLGYSYPEIKTIMNSYGWKY